MLRGSKVLHSCAEEAQKGDNMSNKNLGAYIIMYAILLPATASDVTISIHVAKFSPEILKMPVVTIFSQILASLEFQYLQPSASVTMQLLSWNNVCCRCWIIPHYWTYMYLQQATMIEIIEIWYKHWVFEGTLNFLKKDLCTL